MMNMGRERHNIRFWVWMFYSYRKIAFILASKNKIFKTVHDSEQLCADKIKHKNCANSRLFISLFEFTLRRMDIISGTKIFNKQNNFLYSSYGCFDCILLPILDF